MKKIGTLFSMVLLFIAGGYLFAGDANMGSQKSEPSQLVAVNNSTPQNQHYQAPRRTVPPNIYIYDPYPYQDYDKYIRFGFLYTWEELPPGQTPNSRASQPQPQPQLPNTVVPVDTMPTKE